MTAAEYLQTINEVNANGRYKESWQSLAGHKTPDWYRRGKFGIFIHWGVYSVPAFGNEWYPRMMYTPGSFVSVFFIFPQLLYRSPNIFRYLFTITSQR